MQSQAKKWTSKEASAWRKRQTIKRSYQQEVIAKVEELKKRFDVSQYGELNYEEGNYPLFLVKSKSFDKKKPNILITGGVHGYETSGVQGALAFMSGCVKNYEQYFNFVCAPCVSPWGYETINRWNPEAIDPNRNFFENSEAQECSKFYQELHKLDLKFLAHFDLHETTDTDNTVFRPDLEKRDGIKQELWEIRDGFYLVADSANPQIEFQKAIIQSVARVTHIAPTDEAGKIIGVSPITEGTITYDVQKLHLCASLTDAKFVTTTEVYPDSPRVTNDQCNQAQVAAICGGLDYLRSLEYKQL